MEIRSGQFQNGEAIPDRYTCRAEGVNPPLEFHEVPENAESLVLIMDDPDAPGGNFIHWVLYNIPPTINFIDENSIPDGAIEGNGTSKIGYYPPCPPSGSHRYIFKLFALSGALSLPHGATVEEIHRAMEGHIIESAELMGRVSAEQT